MGFDQRAVQDYVRHALAMTPGQDFVQVRGMVGENIDALVQVAVAGGLRDAGIAGQAMHAPALAELVQHQHRLSEWPQGSRAARGADPAPMRDKKAGEELD